MGKHEDCGKPYPAETVLVALYGPEGGWFAEVFRVNNYTASEFPVKKRPVKHRLHAEYAGKKKVRYLTSCGELRRVGGGGIAQLHREIEVGGLWKKPR